MSDKIIRKFSGFMHEDGPKFMQEFESYLTLSVIDNEQRVIAAFHLHLKGPVLTWSIPCLPETVGVILKTHLTQNMRTM